jgi:hypothetical protein
MLRSHLNDLLKKDQLESAILILRDKAVNQRLESGIRIAIDQLATLLEYGNQQAKAGAHDINLTARRRADTRKWLEYWIEETGTSLDEIPQTTSDDLIKAHPLPEPEKSVPAAPKPKEELDYETLLMEVSLLERLRVKHEKLFNGMGRDQLARLALVGQNIRNERSPVEEAVPGDIQFLLSSGITFPTHDDLPVMLFRFMGTQNNYNFRFPITIKTLAYLREYQATKNFDNLIDNLLKNGI